MRTIKIVRLVRDHGCDKDFFLIRQRITQITPEECGTSACANMSQRDFSEVSELGGVCEYVKLAINCVYSCF